MSRAKKPRSCTGTFALVGDSLVVFIPYPSLAPLVNLTREKCLAAEFCIILTVSFLINWNSDGATTIPAGAEAFPLT